MDTKINLPQLAKTLAKKKGMSQKEAEAFLREFFDAIIQNVTIDKIVKIKGLGTFKLIEVLDRESVNVSTGERIVIPGHSKLSFTPDTSLKDMVNKPFADFQTVVINEDTSLEEMEKIDDEPEQEPESEPEFDQTFEPVVTSKPEPEPPTASELEPELATTPELEPEPVTVSEPESEVMLEPGGDTVDDVDPFAPEKFGALTTAEKWALTLGIILLCLLSYFVGYYRLINLSDIVPQKKSVKKEVPAPYEERNKNNILPLSEDTLDAVLAIDVEEKKDNLTSREKVDGLVLAPDKKYQITGTRKTHIMKSGDYLTKIALKEYGDRRFAQYIIAHNRFRDPNNVPVGMEIKLPELEEVK